ncbi:hypothetical protein HPB51_009429 [Rhipicephalus microplus]|uniref:Uncharacterized protein n=1 Tax=Rhipicephalus microplus TaxID=6941 RepID=A0A9J6E0J6_RHIMP|nr:hypothetical protein HPB51_009429 [Rhipicephalus microplus]
MPVPAPNQTFAASAEKRCRSRMAPVLLMSVHSGQAGRKKRRRQRRRKSGSRSSPEVAQPTAINPAPPLLSSAVALGAPRRGITVDGPPGRRSTVRQPLPTPPKPELSLHGLKPEAQGDASWADRVRQGSQAVEALANHSSSPNPTRIGQVPNAMNNTPSERINTAVHLAPLKARLGSLEAQLTSIVTTIEDRLTATLQTVFDHITGMIVAQTTQLSDGTHRSKVKRESQSQVRRPVSQVVEEAAEHAAQLSDSNWVERCNDAANHMSNRNTAFLQDPQRPKPNAHRNAKAS